MKKKILTVMVGCALASSQVSAGLFDWIVPTTNAPSTQDAKNWKKQEKRIYKDVVNLEAADSRDVRNVGYQFITENLSLSKNDLEVLKQVHKGYEPFVINDNPNDKIANEIIDYLNNSEIDIVVFNKTNLGKVARSERDYIKLSNSFNDDNPKIQSIINIMNKLEDHVEEDNFFLGKSFEDLKTNVLIHYLRGQGEEHIGRDIKDRIRLSTLHGVEKVSSRARKDINKNLISVSMVIKPAWQLSRATFFKVRGEKKIKGVAKTLSAVKSLNFENAETAVWLAANSGDLLIKFFEFKSSAEKIFGKNAQPTAADWANFATKKIEIVTILRTLLEKINNNADDLKPLGVAGNVATAATAITSLLTSFDKYEEIAKQKQKLQLIKNDPQFKKLELYLDVTSDLHLKQMWSDITDATTSIISLTGKEYLTESAEIAKITSNLYLDAGLEQKRQKLQEWKNYYDNNNKKLRNSISKMEKELLKAEYLMGKKVIKDNEKEPIVLLETIEKKEEKRILTSPMEHKQLKAKTLTNTYDEKNQSYTQTIYDEKGKVLSIQHQNAHDFMCSATGYQTSAIGGCASTMGNRQGGVQDTTSTQADNAKIISNETSKLPTAHEQSVNKRDVAIATGNWKVVLGDKNKHLSVGKKFGTIVSPNGNPITALNNADLKMTMMKRTYTVPHGVRSVDTSLLANFVTNEYPKFVNTEFNDKVTIDVVTGSGTSYNIMHPFSQELNSAKFKKDLVSGLPSPMMNTGGQTGFKKVNIENIPIANDGKFHVKVTNINKGDQAYPSAILISDNVKK
ncbi:MAG: hypothetical protein KGV46_03875 [Pasteurella sp.]|nr:hypothetical protein [Pasteurella sp.]